MSANNSKSSKSSHEKILNHLIEVISESVENDEDTLREAFADERLNYDDIVHKGLQFISSLERDIRFKRARLKQQKLIQLLNNVKTDTYKRTKNELINTLKGMFSGNLAAAYFHKLESANEEDLTKIVNETEILKLFEDEMRKEKDIE